MTQLREIVVYGRVPAWCDYYDAETYAEILTDCYYSALREADRVGRSTPGAEPAGPLVLVSLSPESFLIPEVLRARYVQMARRPE